MKKILEILEIKDIKQNKKYFFVRVLISFLIGISFFLDSILVFKDWDSIIYWSNTKNCDVYFTQPTFNSFVILFSITIISFIVISILHYIIDKSKIFETNENKKKNDKVFVIIFVCIFLMWLPYFLTFFPGGHYGDVEVAINQAIGKGGWNNHQPIFFTAIIYTFFNISKIITGSYQTGYNLLGLSQYLLMTIFISYFIYWFYKKGFNKWIIFALTLVIGVFKLFPFYAVTIWKETPFSIFVVLLCFQIADIVLSKGEKLKNNKFIFLYILNILISFLRNNGIYIVIATSIFLFFVFRKYKKFLISTLITIVLVVIIQGPIYKNLKISTMYCENIGIPLQQIGYVIVNNGNITEEQMEYLNSILSVEKLKILYAPWNVDCIKVNRDLKYGDIPKETGLHAFA